ncbi:MAG TPA: metal-sulfur cluster assembly factor [Lutibacter sp.]|nr:metal-sulfur cluster assembly factor [Lutibacter sp.]
MGILEKTPKKTNEEIVAIEIDIIENILSHVMDPEIEIDIVNLGLIYELDYDGKTTVDIEMTLSTPACPLSDAIVANVKESIKQKYTDFVVNVKLVFEPLWHAGMITEAGKVMLGM